MILSIGLGSHDRWPLVATGPAASGLAASPSLSHEKDCALARGPKLPVCGRRGSSDAKFLEIALHLTKPAWKIVH